MSHLKILKFPVNFARYINIHILHNNCLNHKEINEVCEIFPLNQFSNFKINLIDVSHISTLINKDKVPSGLGFFWLKEILFKLFLPELLLNIDKVLHLDTDVMIKGDIKRLFEIKEEYIFKGAKSHNKGWANAGVMLINLNNARKLNSQDKIVSFLNNKNVTEEEVIFKLFSDKIDFYENEIAISIPLNKQLNSFENVISVHFLFPKPFAINRSLKSKTLYNEYYKYLKDFIKKDSLWKFNILVFIFCKIFSIYYSLQRRYKRWKCKILKQKYELDKADNDFYMTKKIYQYSIIKYCDNCIKNKDA